MSTQEKVSLTLSINKEYRDRLRTMAAQQNLNDPDQLTSASTLAREIICEHINKMQCHQNGVEKVDQDADLSAESETGKDQGRTSMPATAK